MKNCEWHSHWFPSVIQGCNTAQKSELKGGFPGCCHQSMSGFPNSGWWACNRRPPPALARQRTSATHLKIFVSEMDALKNSQLSFLGQSMDGQWPKTIPDNFSGTDVPNLN